MAKFTPVAGLDQIVARMIAPAQRKIAEQVEAEAKRLAPATKTWVHVGDGLVRRAHRQAGGQEVPENLRFDLTSFEWDLKHPAVGALTKGTPGGNGWAGQEAAMVPGHSTWMLYPRDQTPRAFVQAVNCFPADTLVSGLNVEGAFRRWYEGPIVRVETEQGRVLTGTPNHPVLTDRGWVPLGRLDVRDRLVCHDVAGHPPGGPGAVAEPDEEHAPARIDEVTRALSVGGFTQRVAGAAVDFHGDGGEAEVDAVRAERLLHVGTVPPLLDESGELDLADADVLLPVALDMAGARRRRLPHLGRVAATLARLGGQVRALAWFGPGHAREHGLGAVARLGARVFQAPLDDGAGDAVRRGEGVNRGAGRVGGHDLGDRKVDAGGALPLEAPVLGEPSALEPVVDGGVGDAKFGGEVLDRLSGSVALDQVRVAVRHEFSGWVYNLQTTAGWYVANGIVVHNCRCQLTINPDGISKLIRTERTVVVGTKVTTTVAAVGKWVVEAEQGTVYPSMVGDLVSLGKPFMGPAALAVAARSRGRR